MNFGFSVQAQPKLVRIHKKSERRDLVREKKAEKAAKISNAIQKELLSRLNDPEVDVYNGIYNFPAKEFKKVVKSQIGEEEEEDLDEEELDDEQLGDMEDMEEEEEDNVGAREMLVDEFVEAMSDEDVEEVGGVMRGRFGGDDDDLDDEDEELDNLLRSIRKRKSSGAPAPSSAHATAGKKRRPRVEIEHEGEVAEQRSMLQE